MQKAKIVLDGFGGDNSPKEVVLGAIDAVNKFDDIEIVITGKQDVIENILRGKMFE